MEKRPRSRSGTGVLTRHEEGNHDMRNFLVLEGLSITVGLLHEGFNHIWFVVLQKVYQYQMLRKMQLLLTSPPARRFLIMST